MNKKLIVLVIILGYVLIRGVFVEPNSIDVTRYQIQNYQLQGIRIVFLTDFHLKRAEYKRLDKIVSYTNQLEPDLVLLGGDFATGHNIKNMMSPEVLAQKLSLLNAPTYSVLGEHDWWAGGDEIKTQLQRNRIRVLENANTRIIVKRRLMDLVGIADATTRQVSIQKSLSRTVSPRIIITHNPDVYFDILDEAAIILAGHTHGGQFVIPYTKPMFVSSKFGSKFANGLIKETQNKMIISRGLGTSGFPIRFFCKPEIVVIDFTRYVPGSAGGSGENGKSKNKIISKVKDAGKKLTPKY